MEASKKNRLIAAGWQIGSAEDFLGLTPVETEPIGLRICLARAVLTSRLAQDVSQSEWAKRLHSSQSRVAKIASGDPNVSIDLALRALLNLGADRKALAALLRTA